MRFGRIITLALIGLSLLTACSNETSEAASTAPVDAPTTEPPPSTLAPSTTTDAPSATPTTTTAPPVPIPPGLEGSGPLGADDGNTLLGLAEPAFIEARARFPETLGSIWLDAEAGVIRVLTTSESDLAALTELFTAVVPESRVVVGLAPASWIELRSAADLVSAAIGRGDEAAAGLVGFFVDEPNSVLVVAVEAAHARSDEELLVVVRAIGEARNDLPVEIRRVDEAEAVSDGG